MFILWFSVFLDGRLAFVPDGVSMINGRLEAEGLLALGLATFVWASYIDNIVSHRVPWSNSSYNQPSLLGLHKYQVNLCPAAGSSGSHWIDDQA